MENYERNAQLPSERTYNNRLKGTLAVPETTDPGGDPDYPPIGSPVPDGMLQILLSGIVYIFYKAYRIRFSNRKHSFKRR